VNSFIVEYLAVAEVDEVQDCKNEIEDGPAEGRDRWREPQQAAAPERERRVTVCLFSRRPRQYT